MTDLYFLLSQYSVLESLVAALALADLFNLSKVSSSYRALLKGFPCESASLYYDRCSRVRSSLHLGEQTRRWQNLKSMSQLQCSEPKHTKGMNPRGCRMCSAPVCEACIVKSSFGKNEHTFENRRRHLCDECWFSGNPHAGRLRYGVRSPTIINWDHGDVCRCSAKDGILCSQCKIQQNTDLDTKLEHCAGQDCSSILNGETARVCLWCALALPSPRTREESRRIYESRHLFEREKRLTATAQ